MGSNLNKIKEKDLIAACIRKDPKAQRLLYEQFAKKCYATCLRYLGQQGLAQDALQESFIKAFKYIKGFDPERGKLQNWMIKICVNECLKMLNKKKSFVDIDTQHELVKVENSAGLSMDADYLYEEILKLPIQLRTVFNLHAIEGFKHKEIGHQLGIAESSSRSILTRAKKRLKHSIEAQEKEILWRKGI